MSVILAKPARGGGSGGVSTWTTLTVDTTTTVFAVASQPTDVVADGILYFAGLGYTYSALNITFDQAPQLYAKWR